MMRMRMVLVAVLLSLGLATPVSAQVSRADSAAVLLETARAFEADERWDVAEALYQLLTRRYGDTPAAALARERLIGAPASRSSGRTELTVWSTLYGLWLGTAIPIIADSDAPEAYGAGLLLGGPVGFLAGRTLARSRPLSSGQARAITFGGTWGTWQGFGWGFATDLGAEEVCDFDVCYQSDEDEQHIVAAGVAGGLAGIATGTILSRREISDGLATTINFGALWGTWFGFAGSYLVDLEDDALLTGTLLGGNAGLVTTALLGRQWNLSRSRARLISIAGVVGGLSGLGLDLIFQPDDEKVAIAIPLAGSIAGLVLGATRTRNRPGTERPEPAPVDQGALLNLSGLDWDLGTPAPVPIRVPLEGAPGFRTVWAVPWLRARF